MGKKKYNFGKRFSQFLSKIFWHFNQQPAPNFSYTNSKRSPSSKKLIKKHGLKSVYKNSAIERYYIRSQYPARYRTCSMWERRPTLAVIQEE